MSDPAGASLVAAVPSGPGGAAVTADLPGAPSDRADARRRSPVTRRRAVVTATGVYVATRAALLVEADVLGRVHHLGIAGILSPWDGGYYAGIATVGYPAELTPGAGSSLAFFPLFPLVGRLLTDVTGWTTTWSLVVVSMVAGLALVGLGTALAADRFGPERAWRAGVILACFPGSVVLGLTYADSLAAAFSAGALLLAGRRRWWAAGICGALATATLSLSVVPVVVALAAAAIASRQRRGVVAPLVSLGGVGAFFAYLWAHTGSPLTWYRAEHAGWNAGLALPWRSGTGFSIYPFSTTGATVVTTLSIAAAAGGIALLAVRRAPAHWSVLSIVTIAAVCLDGAVWLAPRYLLDAFPLVLAGGVSLPRRAVGPVAVVSACAMLALLAAYSPPNRVFFNP